MAVAELDDEALSHRRHRDLVSVTANRPRRRPPPCRSRRVPGPGGGFDLASWNIPASRTKPARRPKRQRRAGAGPHAARRRSRAARTWSRCRERTAASRPCRPVRR
jgi:hypothetical protein